MSLPRTMVWVAALLASWPVFTSAQQPVQRDYPSKPIRVVVPYAAGGPMDFIARTLGRKMQNVATLVVDNRPGAGGALGTDVVAKSPPDGYTILHTSSSHASLPVITRSLPYDPIRDFAPITLIVNSVGFLLVAHQGVPARSVQEFVAGAKAQPGKLTYGSGGVGNVMHFAPEPYVARIRGEVAKALEDPEVRRTFADQGFVPVGSTSAEFTKTIVAEIEANRRLAAKIGLKPE